MDGNAGMMTLTKTLFGKEIGCCVTRLDEGIHVLLVGGDKSHIGAISIAQADGTVETKVFPGHKEQFISEPWAKQLAQTLGEPATVVCGIHYDHATGEQIQEILRLTDAFLNRIIEEV